MFRGKTESNGTDYPCPFHSLVATPLKIVIRVTQTVQALATSCCSLRSMLKACFCVKCTCSPAHASSGQVVSICCRRYNTFLHDCIHCILRSGMFHAQRFMYVATNFKTMQNYIFGKYSRYEQIMI